MAFQPQGGQDREVQNRKILQDLQERKRQMMNQQSISGAASSAISSHPARQEPAALRGDNHQLSVNQRQALEQAHAMSPGYYVTQDSLFGNLILPVIPRLENDT